MAYPGCPGKRPLDGCSSSSSFFDLWMCAFVVLGLVFSIPRQEIGLGKRLGNDLFCVKWDVKPQLNQSINVHCTVLLMAGYWMPDSFYHWRNSPFLSSRRRLYSETSHVRNWSKCMSDFRFLSSVSFYRAMLCIRGTSHGAVSVCLSQVGVLLKRLNGGSHKQHHTIPQGV